MPIAGIEAVHKHPDLAAVVHSLLATDVNKKASFHMLHKYRVPALEAKLSYSIVAS